MHELADLGAQFGRGQGATLTPYPRCVPRMRLCWIDDDQPTKPSQTLAARGLRTLLTQPGRIMDVGQI